MVVTATVTELDRLDDAKAALVNLSAAARILLRPAYGSQDSAFAASLRHSGLVLPAHLKVPGRAPRRRLTGAHPRTPPVTDRTARPRRAA